ncbi:uncharacterized protein LOC143940257 [Lithobates pipiens]
MQRKNRMRKVPTHPFKVGDQVVVQRLQKGRKPQEVPFGPVTKVVTVTRTAILTEESPIWIHASKVKKVYLSLRIEERLKRGEAGVLSSQKTSTEIKDSDVTHSTTDFWEGPLPSSDVSTSDLCPSVDNNCIFHPDDLGALKLICGKS